MFPTPRQPKMAQPMSGSLGSQHLSRSATPDLDGLSRKKLMRLNPSRRHRGLFIFAATITGLAAVTRYRTRQNEQAQRNASLGHPNYYVSVERSGGGI